MRKRHVHHRGVEHLMKVANITAIATIRG